MPETRTKSFGATPALSAPALTAFKTPKSPQPGHQSGSTTPSKFWMGSSTLVAIVLSPLALPLSNGLPGIRRTGLDAHLQLSVVFAGLAIYHLNLPDFFAAAI